MWTENPRPLRWWVEEKLTTFNTHATLRAACESFGITGEDEVAQNASVPPRRPVLPALIPQVYLHYDPELKAEEAAKAPVS